MHKQTTNNKSINPFQCNVCEAMFSEKDGLKLRITTIQEWKNLRNVHIVIKLLLKNDITKYITTDHEEKKSILI